MLLPLVGTCEYCRHRSSEASRHLISASSCWGSSDNRSCWRGWRGWCSNQTPTCSWSRGSRTPSSGCGPCTGVTAGTAAEEAVGGEVQVSWLHKHVSCTFTVIFIQSRTHSPAADTSGNASTTGTSACEGRSQPGRSKNTSQCGRRCWPGRQKTLQDLINRVWGGRHTVKSQQKRETFFF